jgi:N-acetylmuramidase
MYTTPVSLGTVSEYARLIQKALNERMRVRFPGESKNIYIPEALKTDGSFGSKSVEVLRQYQTLSGLPATGIYAEPEETHLGEYIKKRFISITDITQAAKKNNLPSDVLNALAEQEGKGDGFLPDCRPVILFERHKFYQYSKATMHPADFQNMLTHNSDICNTVPGGYSGGSEEYMRLTRATAICQDAALLSTSWGMFQCMGFNHTAVGYSDLHQFVEDMHKSEGKQLLALINFIKANNNLLNAIKTKNFAKIALYYNGANYAINHYDTKLAELAKKFA